jgi:hypothetical protein
VASVNLPGPPDSFDPKTSTLLVSGVVDVYAASVADAEKTSKSTVADESLEYPIKPVSVVPL